MVEGAFPTTTSVLFSRPFFPQVHSLLPLLQLQTKMADIKAAETTANSGSQSSLEAGPPVTEKTANVQEIDLDKVGETQGYVLDEAILKEQLGLGADAVIKTAKDGRTVLIPQPTDDPRDPLNWPQWKKHMTLFVVCIAACVGDYGSATGAITLLPQAE